MKGLYVHEVLKAVSGICHGDRAYLVKEIEEADTDSRNLVKNGLFFAIKGSRIDSHDLVKGLFAEGKIVCAVGEQSFEQVFGTEDKEIEGIYIQVINVYQALLKVAALYRSKLNVKIVGITGSVGKTGTKEMIASVLSQKFKVHKTQGNYNNEVGVPLTLFGIKREDDIAVIEMGINGFGQMSTLAAVVRPDIMVMTNIGRCHLEQLKDRDGVLRAKSEALDYLMPGGSFVLNVDDDKLSKIKEWKISDQDHKIQCIKPIGFGIKNRKTEVSAGNISISDDGSASFDILYSSSGKIRVKLNLIGEHHIYNALSAAAVASVFHMEPEYVGEGLEKTTALSGRADLYHLSDRIRLIDDCYNANPDSMRAALSSLSGMKAVNRFAIIGDMLELGSNSKAEHREIAEFILNETNIRKVWLVGEQMVEAYRILEKDERFSCRYFKDVEDLEPEIGTAVFEGELILIKASHSMRFERIKDILMLAFSNR